MCTFQEAWLHRVYLHAHLCISKVFCFFFRQIFNRVMFKGKVIFIILIGLHAFVNTYLLWPLSLAWAEAPKPHVNLDNGGLGTLGIVVYQCSGRKGWAVMALQWVQHANFSVTQQFEASLLSCTSLYWIGGLLWFGWDQFIWRLALLLSRWVSAFVAYIGLDGVAGRNSLSLLFLAIKTFHSFQSPRFQLFRG